MGFAAGFQVGAQAVERGLRMREENKLKEGLAKAYGAPESFNDYTPQDTKLMQGLTTGDSGSYDVQAIPGAEGQPPTLRYTTKQGLDLQGDSPASIDFSPQQVQRYGNETVAGQFDPMKLRALQSREAARVTGLSGDARGAAQLFQQAEDADFSAQRRPLELEGLRQQARLTDAQLSQVTRTEAAAKLEETRQKENAAWWTKQTTDAEGNRRAPRPEDYLAASQRDASSFYQTGNYEKGGQAYDAFMNRAEAQINSQERDRKRQGELAFTAVQNGNYQAGIDYYNKFLPNGSVATKVVEGKNGELTITHKDLSGNKLPDTKITKEQLLQGIASFGDSKQALTYIQQSFMNNIQTEQLGLQRRNTATSEAQLKVSQANQETNADTAQSNKINSIRQFALTEEQVRQRGVSNYIPVRDAKTDEIKYLDPSKLKAGKDGVMQLPEGLVPVKSARKEPTDAAVVSGAKALMADYSRNFKMVEGKKVPISMEEAMARVKASLRTQNAEAPGEENDDDRIIRLMRLARERE